MDHDDHARAPLHGKVAIVTGASKGIGASIALHMAAAGAAVVVNYATSRTGADRVVASIAAGGGKAIAVQGDVARKADVERIFAETARAFGGVDILVNNAGVYAFTPIDTFTEEHFRRQFDINVLGLLFASQEAARLLRTGGCIINVSSVISSATTPGAAVYAATKASVDAITRVLSKELGPRGIRVNSVNPGMVETEGTSSVGITEGEFRASVEASTPLGRIGQPGDVSPLVVFLASPQAGWITGETIVIAGGYR